jgi:hypothetical protein
MEVKMRQIKRFEPISVMKIAAICYALFGFVEGAIFSVFLATIPFAARNGANMPRFLAPVFGVLSIVFFPILFAVIGAIGGGLGAVIYNVAAKYVGGIEVEVT